MNSIEYKSPAKLNLMLSIHGQRGDGFHDLSSLVVGLDFGDQLRVSLTENDCDELICEDQLVPRDGTNLILKAANRFRKVAGFEGYFRFELEKRVPMGAGLGGGSSNASYALRAMDAIAGSELSSEALRSIAATLGSDCAFFIDAGVSLMTGRGDCIEPSTEEVRKSLSGRRVSLFRPNFPIHTDWAYKQLIKAGPSAYASKASADERLARFERMGRLGDLLFNTFEDVVGEKFGAIPCLLEILRKEGIDCLMSGSGSSCFAIPKNDTEAAVVRKICKNTWGSDIFFIETSIC